MPRTATIMPSWYPVPALRMLQTSAHTLRNHSGHFVPGSPTLPPSILSRHERRINRSAQSRQNLLPLHESPHPSRQTSSSSQPQSPSRQSGADLNREVDNTLACTSPVVHHVAQLLINRTNERHRHAWTRKNGFRRTNRHAPHSAMVQITMFGLTFMAVLITYLALNLTSGKGPNTGINIALVVLLIVLGIFLLHGVLRGLLQPHRIPRRLHGRRRHHRHRASTNEYTYFAQASDPNALPDDDAVYSPITPVRVHLIYEEKDILEQADGPHSVSIASPIHPADVALPNSPDESIHDDDDAIRPQEDAIRVPPPAYGLWRCSVRADPGLLHWQRIGSMPATDMEDTDVSRTAPPTYFSAPEARHDESGNPETAQSVNVHLANSASLTVLGDDDDVELGRGEVLEEPWPLSIEQQEVEGVQGLTRALLSGQTH